MKSKDRKSLSFAAMAFCRFVIALAKSVGVADRRVLAAIKWSCSPWPGKGVEQLRLLFSHSAGSLMFGESYRPRRMRAPGRSRRRTCRCRRTVPPSASCRSARNPRASSVQELVLVRSKRLIRDLLRLGDVAFLDRPASPRRPRMIGSMFFGEGADQAFSGRAWRTRPAWPGLFRSSPTRRASTGGTVP